MNNIFAWGLICMLSVLLLVLVVWIWTRPYRGVKRQKQVDEEMAPVYAARSEIASSNELRESLANSPKWHDYPLGDVKHKHHWQVSLPEPKFQRTFYKFVCDCGASKHIRKQYFWKGNPLKQLGVATEQVKQSIQAMQEAWGIPPMTTTHHIEVTTETEALTEALEAIRFTQEYAQLPCVDGWAWWDFYKMYRPDDAKRFKNEWEAFNRDGRYYEVAQDD